MKRVTALMAATGLAVPLLAVAQTADDASAPAEGARPEVPAEVTPTIPAPSVDVPAPVAPTPAASDSTELDTVVVTARRTAENLQDVPVAISAMSDQDLEREQIKSPQDLQGRVPSLVIGTGSQMRNTESPTIRGQGAQFGSSAGVVIYMGEVPLPSDPVATYQGGPGKFFDLSSVQILKGSQGTLFGRNTTGGALLLEPHKPEDSFSASLRAGGTELSGGTMEGVLNVPVIEDTLLARVGGQLYHRGGFTEDVVTGKDYDSKHYWAGRLGLTWRVRDGIENYTLVHYADSNDHGTATVIERINKDGLNKAIPSAVGLGAVPQPNPQDPNQGPGCAVLDFYGPSTNCGDDILAEQQARGIRRVQLSGDPNDILKSGAVVNNSGFELNEQLALRNIASYSSLLHTYRWDLDGSRAAFNEFTNPTSVFEADIRTASEELQLQGQALDDALKFTVGTYYERTEAAGRIVGTSLLFVSVDQSYRGNKRSFAPYAQGTYDLGNLFGTLSGLSLTLGARRTSDKAFAHSDFEQVAGGQYQLEDQHVDAATAQSAVTYTAGLDYKLRGSLIYGKLSRGYKSGGISTIAVNPDHRIYRPEFVKNYELGQKSGFAVASMPLRINSAIYYTDYTDLQTSSADAYVDPNSPSPVPQLGQAIFNAGKAYVAGLELEATVRPLPDLTLLANYGYTRAAYREFKFVYGGATAQLDCTGQEIQTGNVVDMSCVPYLTTPKHQYSVSARYVLPTNPALGNIESAVTWAWTGKQYSAHTPEEAEPGAWLPQYGLLNTSLSWKQIHGTAFDVQLFGTNLLDKVYRVSNSNQWNLTYMQSSIYSEPRFIGMNFGYHWGNS